MTVRRAVLIIPYISLTTLCIKNIRFIPQPSLYIINPLQNEEILVDREWCVLAPPSPFSDPAFSLYTKMLGLWILLPNIFTTESKGRKRYWFIFARCVSVQMRGGGRYAMVSGYRIPCPGLWSQVFSGGGEYFKSCPRSCLRGLLQPMTWIPQDRTGGIPRQDTGQGNTHHPP